jgi:NADPH:quinone reductase-like Zn-dependent oxidoreductase
VLEPELALKLGVAPNRIDTIIDFAAAAKYGVKAEGNHEAATADVLPQLAGLLAAGRLEIPIAKVYPLAEVRDDLSRAGAASYAWEDRS